MLKFKELQGLSTEELVVKAKPVSVELVSKLVKDGVLKEDTAVLFDGLEVEYPTSYIVENDSLYAMYNDTKREEYVVGLIGDGFNVVSADGLECANIYVNSVGENVVNCDGGFVFLCQVDLFDMED